MKSFKFPRHLRLVAAGLLISAASGFGLVAMASAQEGPTGDGPHDRPHGMMRGEMPPPMMMGMGGMPMAGPMFEHLLKDVNATPEQAEQLRKIGQAAAADLKVQHEAAQAERQQMLQLFMQPVVDAKAAELMRQKSLARHDVMSARMTQAMLEASKVLTPEQRRQIGERMAAHAAQRGERGGQPGTPGSNAPRG
jgi:protein CpxP